MKEQIGCLRPALSLRYDGNRAKEQSGNKHYNAGSNHPFYGDALVSHSTMVSCSRRLELAIVSRNFLYTGPPPSSSCKGPTWQLRFDFLDWSSGGGFRGVNDFRAFEGMCRFVGRLNPRWTHAPSQAQRVAAFIIQLKPHPSNGFGEIVG